MFSYSIFGMELNSELEFPELEISSEVRGMKIGDHPFSLTESNRPIFEELVKQKESKLYVIDQSVKLHFDGLCQMLIEKTGDITFHKFEGMSEFELRTYLLGLAVPILALQQGLLPLHASAITDGTQTILFSGSSGAGKSTIATAFTLNGDWKMISDDVVCFTAPTVNIGGHVSKTMVLGGPRTFRLWQDSIASLQLEENLKRIGILGKNSKYSFIKEEMFENFSHNITYWFDLSWDKDLEIAEVTSAANKIEIILNSQYISYISHAIIPHVNRMRIADDVMSHTKFYKVKRSRTQGETLKLMIANTVRGQGQR